MILKSLLHAVACAIVCASPVLAQCNDPRPPRSGFKFRFDKDQTLTFSDGYKTLANVLVPDVAPGPCGWPLLVLVHGLSGSRNTASLEAGALVTQGYVVIQYDVRAQGDARANNPSKHSTLWALDEWIDMADAIDWVAARYPGKVDKDRVAVFGDSQGGVHAWAAAAYSGKTLPPNSRRTKFPKIVCVAARFFSPDPIAEFVPDGTAFHARLLPFAFKATNPIVSLDPAYRKKLARYIDNDDPAGCAAWLRSIPGKDFVGGLATSKVPVLSLQAWQDTWGPANRALAAMATMPKTTPRRLYMTTGEHGTPLNLNQTLRRVFLTETWFRRHLKRGLEPAEKGPPFVTALMPTGANYSDPTSLWRHRDEGAFPATESREQRYYLRFSGKLTTSKPGAGEALDVVDNQVAASYDARAFEANPRLASVVKKIPLSSIAYSTAPLAADLEFGCVPKVSVYARPNASKFLVAARLSVVSPNNKLRVLATGAIGIRQKAGPVPQRVVFSLSPTAFVVPAGHRLRVEIRNLDLQMPLNVESFRRAPFFNSSTVRLEHTKLHPSWIALSVRPRVKPEIMTADTTISVTNPGVQHFKIRSSAEWKNTFYVVLLGFSGQGPPVRFPNGSKLWMVPDQATVGFVQAINMPILANFGGVLDAQGSASCSLALGFLGKLPLGVVGSFVQVAPTFFTFDRGFEPGTPVRLRFR